MLAKSPFPLKKNKFSLFGWPIIQKLYLHLQRRKRKKKGLDMSTATLEGLRDYLYSTLSPSNMIWLSTQLAEYAKQLEEPPLKRYTLEEMKAQLLQAKRDFDAGLGIPNEEVMREWEEELKHEEQEQYELAEAV